MKSAWILLGVAFAACLASCEGQPKVPIPAAKEVSSGKQPAIEPAASANLWERSRQCADQADKVVERVERELAAYGPGAARLNKWENRYSPKFERCFVLVTYQQKPDKGLGIPLFFNELIDAFENRVLATGVPLAGSTAEYNGYCDLASDHTADCLAVRLFIEERMSK